MQSNSGPFSALKENKKQILQEKFISPEGISSSMLERKIQGDMQETGFIPFFNERDHLGRINHNGRSNYGSPEAQRMKRKRQLCGLMHGTKLNKHMASNTKPKINIATELINWIHAGGSGIHAEQDKTNRLQYNEMAEGTISEEEDYDQSQMDDQSHIHSRAQFGAATTYVGGDDTTIRSYDQRGGLVQTVNTVRSGETVEEQTARENRNLHAVLHSMARQTQELKFNATIRDKVKVLGASFYSPRGAAASQRSFAQLDKIVRPMGKRNQNFNVDPQEVVNPRRRRQRYYPELPVIPNKSTLSQSGLQSFSGQPFPNGQIVRDTKDSEHYKRAMFEDQLRRKNPKSMQLGFPQKMNSRSRQLIAPMFNSVGRSGALDTKMIVQQASLINFSNAALSK